MAGRTPNEAVQNFIEPLQLAVSCVARAFINIRGGYHPQSEPHALTLNRGEPIRLSANPPILFSVIQHYRIVEYEGHRGPWKVSTVGYLYSLQDSEEHEIITYHWHPTERSRVTFPHAHLGAGASIGRDDLVKAHLPTGRIAIEDIIRLAITGFGVRPLRPDWSDLLDSTQSAYEDWRTWS